MRTEAVSEKLHDDGIFLERFCSVGFVNIGCFFFCLIKIRYCNGYYVGL